MRLSRARADWATDTGPTDAAISIRVFVQVLLVIILGEVVFRCGFDFGGDRSEASGGEAWLIEVA